MPTARDGPAADAGRRSRSRAPRRCASTEIDEGLWDDVRGLPVKQRKAVVLRFAGDQSYPEIAAGDVDHPGLGAPERARGPEETQKGAAR